MLRAARTGQARAFAAGLFLCAALGAPVAFADDGLPPQGARIDARPYSIDLFQGPTLASSRVTAMGGAYAGLAEGAEGIPINPAAASQRPPYSTTRNDFEITGGTTFPGSVRGGDFDNNGTTDVAFDSFIFATLGGLFQHDHFGVGAVASFQNYTLVRQNEQVRRLSLRTFKIDVVASYGFLDDQLHIGGGLRGAVLNAIDTSTSTTPLDETFLFGTFGAGVQGGMLWRPRDLPLRCGATLRSPVLAATDITSDVGGRFAPKEPFFFPTGIALPFEAELGVAVQIGPRPLNAPWIDEETLTGPDVEDERRMGEPLHKAARRILRRSYRATNRQKVLLSFSTLISGPTKGAVGVESMLEQVVDRSGVNSSVTLRLGAEAEVVRDLLQLRAGTYLEPTRFRGGRACVIDGQPANCDARPRAHGTAGFEMRVLEWSVFGIFPEDNVFRITGAADYARDYFGWSLGIGSWY